MQTLRNMSIISFYSNIFVLFLVCLFFICTLRAMKNSNSCCVYTSTHNNTEFPLRASSFKSSSFVRSDSPLSTAHIHNNKWPVSICNMNASDTGMHAHTDMSSASPTAGNIIDAESAQRIGKKYGSHSCRIATNQSRIQPRTRKLIWKGQISVPKQPWRHQICVTFRTEIRSLHSSNVNVA